ncbi:hypothetical protein J9303_05780 [Bacillaceae bacterium Marseille-Q3522]|nr:hypothetical protein [Bacillaceae bacterium Marseille-Q3522]
MDRRRSLPSIQMAKQPYGLAPGAGQTEKRRALVHRRRNKAAPYEIKESRKSALLFRSRLIVSAEKTYSQADSARSWTNRKAESACPSAKE